MSYYYKQQFISPEPIFAKVREELRSYFDSGAVDSTLFPLWTNDCLRKLGKAAYPIYECILPICNYQCKLPDDFKYVREAWSCVEWNTSYQLPSSIYQQLTPTTIGLISSRLDAPDVYCEGNCDYPDVIQAIYKTTEQIAFQFKKQVLLTPGNINGSCPRDLYSVNYNSASYNTYDVKDNKFTTTFPEGTVYMLYYAEDFDSNANQLIPNEIRQLNFIELYLKQKTFEQIYNQTTDESFQQSEKKYLMYKQMADEAYILADIENKSEDVYRIQRSIRRTRRRNNKYSIQ